MGETLGCGAWRETESVSEVGVIDSPEEESSYCRASCHLEGGGQAS